MRCEAAKGQKRRGNGRKRAGEGRTVDLGVYVESMLQAACLGHVFFKEVFDCKIDWGGFYKGFLGVSTR